VIAAVEVRTCPVNKASVVGGNDPLRNWVARAPGLPPALQQGIVASQKLDRFGCLHAGRYGAT
jgi:hypothetical protein